jgi:hypothetical protein
VVFSYRSAKKTKYNEIILLRNIGSASVNIHVKCLILSGISLDLSVTSILASRIQNSVFDLSKGMKRNN